MRKILASTNVVEGYPINAIVYSDGIWWVLNNEDILEHTEVDMGKFVEYDEAVLYHKIPAIKDKLNEEEDTFVFINEKTGEVNINPKHKHWGFSTADGARATNQVNLEISLWTYLANRPDYYTKLVLILLFWIVISIIFSWLFLFYLIRILLTHFFALMAHRNMFLSGTLNPGIVIQVHPVKIAVLTELAKSGEGYPIIRVKKVELPLKYRKLNTRIPIAGSYQFLHNQPFWDFFNPLPIPAGVSDHKIVEKKINEIAVYDWVRLTKNLMNLGSNLKEGYYPIEIESTKWKEIENPVFTQFDEEV